jgi:hypothetical protein
MSQEGPSADKNSGPPEQNGTRIALITTGGTIAAALIGAIALLLTHSGADGTSRPSPSPTMSQSSASPPPPPPSPTVSRSSASPTPTPPRGTIMSPSSGANVAARKNLQVSGTAQDIPTGYRLDLFLEWVNVSKYWIAADPKSAITPDNAHWTAPIYVGDPGSIIIRLVLLSPSQIARIDSPSNAAYLSNGFPTLPGTTLASANYMAKNATSATSSSPPSGTIASPPTSANVAARKNLQVAGTVQRIPTGYRLDLFLQFVNSGNGVRYYIAADPKSAITPDNGHWAAPIYVGDSGPIIIRLVLLSPSQIAYVDSPSSVSYQSNGFPALPGTTLASANYTAQ